MKKKLLFSLLLGSAFAWMNEMYAAEAAATTTAEETKPASDKAVAPKVEEAKKYKLKTKDGKDIEVSFHVERDDIVYSAPTLLDGSVYTMDTQINTGKIPKNADIGIGPNATPFLAGQELPKGYKIINIYLPEDSNGDGISAQGVKFKKYKDKDGNLHPEVFSAAIIQTENISTDYEAPAGYAQPDDYTWMLMSGDNEIFIADVINDPNGKKFFGDQKIFQTMSKADNDNVRLFKLPDPAGTKKLQEALKKAADLEEKLKSAGTGGGSPEDAAKVKELEKQIEELKKNAGSGTAAAIDPSAPLTKTFQFEGMNFVIITSDPAAKSHPELFEELKSNLYKLFSIQPKVGTAIAAMMLKSHESLDGSQGEFVKILIADAYKLMGSDKTINLVAELQFPTEVSYKDAYGYVEGLKNKYNRDDAIREATQPVSAEEAARRQAEHEADLAAERARGEAELAVERAKGEEILAQLEQITKEKAAAEAEMKFAEEEKDKALQQRNAAVEAGIAIASDAIDQADQKAQVAAQNAQIATYNAQLATQKAEEVKSIEVALNESEEEKQKALNDAEAEKARLTAVQQQTQTALAATQNDLMTAKISEATLSAKHEAAMTAAEKAEKDAAAVKEQLKDAHGALLDVATSTSNSTEAVTSEHVDQTPVDANTHAPIAHEEQVTASVLTASAPLPVSNSLVTSVKKSASIIPDIHDIAPAEIASTAAAAG